MDAFDADPLTYRNVPVTATVDTYTGLQLRPPAPTEPRSSYDTHCVSQWPFVTRGTGDDDAGRRRATGGVTVDFVVDDAADRRHGDGIWFYG